MPEYLSLFYIFNLLLIAIYPLIRNYGHTFMLNIRDTWGFKRESQIITGILTIILLRFVKYSLHGRNLYMKSFSIAKLEFSFSLYSSITKCPYGIFLHV